MNVIGIDMDKNRQCFKSWKQKAINKTVRHLIDDTKEITDLKETNACVLKFHKKKIKNNVFKSDLKRELFLNSITLLNLSSKSFDIREGKITEKELIKVCP